MKNGYGIAIGIWRIEQDRTTLEVVLYRYGNAQETWLENHVLDWEEMSNILAEKSCAKREE